MQNPLPQRKKRAQPPSDLLGATDMAEGCGVSYWLAVSVAVILALVLLRKVFLLVTGDADLTLLSKSLVPDFFRNKVVWVTGASSGSETDIIIV